MLKKLYNIFIRPSWEIKSTLERQRARILSTILIPVLLVAPIGVLTSHNEAERTSVGLIFLINIFCYLLSRTRYFKQAGIVAMLSFTLPPYAMLFALENFTQASVLSITSWLNLFLLLSSMWLPIKLITVMWVANLAFLLLLPLLFLPALSYDMLSIGVLQLFVFGAIIISAAKLRANDQRDLLKSYNELTIAKNEAEESNKAKSQFLSNMSHEFRTPLHGIISFSTLALEKGKSLSDEKLHHFFNQIKLSGERLKSLVDELLDLNKLELGILELNFKPVSIPGLIETALEEQAANLDEKRLQIQTSYEQNLPTIESDKNRLIQVILNLLGNAIKFSPANGTIKFTVSTNSSSAENTNENAILIQISDEGPGIPEEELDIVFEKFFQSKHNTHKSGSTGLGLAISRDLILAHHGTIWCENQKEGGAKFLINLPLSQPAKKKN